MKNLNLPHALEIENSVIGAIIYERECLVIAMTEIITENIFFSEVNKIIFKTIKQY